MTLLDRRRKPYAVYYFLHASQEVWQYCCERSLSEALRTARTLWLADRVRGRTALVWIGSPCRTNQPRTWRVRGQR
jgi:hypothetical protein